MFVLFILSVVLSHQTTSAYEFKSRPGVPTKTHSCHDIRSVPRIIARTLDLDMTFYSKYTEAYNIPIISSSRVSNTALTRACYVVRVLLADRPDVRKQLYKQGGRVGVIGVNEQTTDIPEHSYLPDWWNQRARGLGGMVGTPISTVGEENLLCLKNDWYPTQDIMVHEFAHGVHMLGAHFADTTFQAQLDELYNEYRRSQEKWHHTYSMSSNRELFGEGTQSYFNVNSYSALPDGISGPINTRNKLEEYDPRLFKLIQGVFPCGNLIYNKCNTTRQWERDQILKMDCELPPEYNIDPTPEIVN